MFRGVSRFAGSRVVKSVVNAAASGPDVYTARSAERTPQMPTAPSVVCCTDTSSGEAERPDTDSHGRWRAHCLGAKRAASTLAATSKGRPRPSANLATVDRRNVRICRVGDRLVEIRAPEACCPREVSRTGGSALPTHQSPRSFVVHAAEIPCSRRPRDLEASEGQPLRAPRSRLNRFRNCYRAPKV